MSERLGLYVHVPWCRRRCPYCDFYFVVGRAEPRYVEAVLDELRARRDFAGADARFDTLYLGGGTPSALGARALAALVGGLRREIHLVDDAEITVEANPEDIDDDLIAALGDVGVNRLSLGVQAFHADALRWLGRVHSPDDARRAVELGQRLGRVSVDIIAGVPGDDSDRVRRDLETVAALGAGHVSTYLLTVEPETPLAGLIARNKRGAVDEDAQADAYVDVQTWTSALGYAQYEVSSYARPGEESRHNRIYWSQGTYLGLGPGAHSMRVDDDGASVRVQNAADVRGYLGAPAVHPFEQERLEPAAALLEAIAFGIRDMGLGVDLSALAERHHSGVPEAVHRALEERVTRGHCEVRRGAGGELRFFLTAHGARFADGVARDVLAAADA